MHETQVVVEQTRPLEAQAAIWTSEARTNTQLRFDVSEQLARRFNVAVRQRLTRACDPREPPATTEISLSRMSLDSHTQDLQGGRMDNKVQFPSTIQKVADAGYPPLPDEPRVGPDGRAASDEELGSNLVFWR